jgi:hypothetical protein
MTDSEPVDIPANMWYVSFGSCDIFLHTVDDDDDDAFIYPDPSQSDMQATTTIYISDYVHVDSSTS